MINEAHAHNYGGMYMRTLHNKARYLCSMVIYALVVKYDQELVLCDLKKNVWPVRANAHNRAHLTTSCISLLGYIARSRMG